MYEVVKRDGQVVDFNIGKIADAIKKAFDATKTEYNGDVIDFLALKVSADFLPKIRDGKVAVEDIQDSVEAVLSRGGYENVAKAYILYRKQREKLRNMKSTYLDYKDTVNKYLHVEDWRVKENSTVTYSVGGLILSNSGAITANYWLSEVYDQEIADAHRNCDIHLHDLSMLTGYCAGWSLKQLIKEGLGIPGKINSSPASHLSTLCNQMVNFLGIMQNEWAGAQAFSSFDTYLAPFVKIDNLSYKEVKQCIQSFVFGVNTPSRWGTQAPFLQGRDGHGQQGLHRHHDRGRRQRPRLPVPDPDLLDHPRLRLVPHREQQAALRDDRQVRHALFLELHQLRHGAFRRALDVLPSPSRPA